MQERQKDTFTCPNHRAQLPMLVRVRAFLRTELALMAARVDVVTQGIKEALRRRRPEAAHLRTSGSTKGTKEARTRAAMAAGDGPNPGQRMHQGGSYGSPRRHTGRAIFVYFFIIKTQ